MMMFATQAFGLPTLENAGGSAGVAVDLINSSSLRITQSNSRAVANWSDFDIAVGESVRIVQPDGQAVLLNRISSQNATEILGSLQANGRVFLLNPKGIVFGPNSQVDVGALVASTFALKPGFQGQGNDIELEALADSGTIMNQGTLLGREIALIAPVVENRGTVSVNVGRVHVLAASEVTVNTAAEFMVFQVEAGHESAVIHQLGQVSSNGGEIILLARSTGSGASSVINLEGIQQANRLTLQGDNVVLSAPSIQVNQTTITADSLAVAGLNATGSLMLNAANTTQTAAITVGGQTTLRNGAATLNHADNNFVGQVVLQDAGPVNLRDTNNLTVVGDATQLAARADEQITINSFNGGDLQVQADSAVLGAAQVTGNLSVEAANTTQTAAITVGGQTRISGGNANLDHVGNDFVGEVLLQNAGDVNLRDANELTITGGGGQTTAEAVDRLSVYSFSATGLNVRATDVEVAEVIVSGDLALRANATTQTAAIAVGGQTTVAGGSVSLTNANNNFTGQVILQNAGQVTLQDINQLAITGTAGAVDARAEQQLNISSLTASSLDAQAGAVVLTGLSLGADFNLNADNATQTNAITVGGRTTIQGGRVTLNDAGNNFAGQVVFQGAAEVSLQGAGHLTVAGVVGQLTAVAGDQLTINNLSGSSLDVQANTLALRGLGISGDVVLSANSATQTAAITVGGQTRLRGGEIVLNNANNDFSGLVVLENVDHARLHDRNALMVTGVANHAALQSVDQLGVTALNAQEVSLLGGQVTLGALNTSGDLVVSAVGGISQTAAITVGGQTTLQNGHVTLSNTGNDFVGQVVLQQAGQVTVHDANSLLIGGTAGDVIASAGAQLTSNQLSADSLDALADSVVLGGLNTAGNLFLNAGTTTQTSAITVGGRTRVQGGNVALNNSGNDFVGQIELQDAGQVSLRDFNNLSITGSAAQLHGRADNQLRINNVDVGSTQLQASNLVLSGLQSAGDAAFSAGNTTQTAALTVGGQTTLQGGSFTLIDAGNDFSGTVQLQGAGHVNLQDRHAVVVSGTANAVVLRARDSANLRELQASTVDVESQSLLLDGVNVRQDMVVNAHQTTQSGALAVGRQLTLEGGNVRLDRQDNRLQGAVVLNATEQAVLASQTGVRIQGQTDFLQANIQANVQVTNLRTSNLQVQGQSVELSGVQVSGDAQVQAVTLTQSDAVHVDGRLTLQGGSVSLGHVNNRFASSVSLSHTGEVVLAAQEQIDIQGAVQGSLTLDAANIRQTESIAVGGRTTLRGDSANLNQSSNQFGAEVVLDGVRHANLRDVDSLSVSGRVGALNAQAAELTQGGDLHVDGETRLAAQRVNLRNSNNRFFGAVNFDGVDEVVLQARGDVNLRGQARQADLQAQGQLAMDVQGLDQLSIRAGSVHLIQANTTGSVQVQAELITQTSAWQVGGNLTVQGGNVVLADAGNDFRGTVTLNGVREAHLNDVNELSLAGRVDGGLHVRAVQIGQHAALSVGNRLIADAGEVHLADSGNQLPNLDLANSRRAEVRTSGNTRVTAAGPLEYLNLRAERVTLGELGRVASLEVNASQLDQQAPLHVGSLLVTSPLVRLGLAGNRVDDVLTLRSPNGGVVDASVSSQTGLGIQADRLSYQGDVQGDLNIRAASLQVRDLRVKGRTDLMVDGAVTQLGPVHLQEARVQAAELDWRDQSNRLEGTLILQVAGTSALGTAGDLSLDTTASQGPLSMKVGGDVDLRGDTVVLGESQVEGQLHARANALTQTGALTVGGDINLEAVGGTISLANEDNQFNGEVQTNSDVINLFNRVDLRLRGLLAREGQLETDGRLLLLGDVRQGAGTLSFVAHHRAMPLSSADLADLLPVSLDVFSNRQVVDPLTGLGRVFVASTAIEQLGGTIASEAGGITRFHSSSNGSVVLVGANRMQGSLSILSGQAQAPYAYLPANGASLAAVNNELALRVASPGMEADLIAVRANGLDTPPGSVLRARMPYNDFAVGAARSFPALTLSVPMSTAGAPVAGREVAPFGEPSSVAGPNPRAIQVRVGETNSPGLGGYMTVLPFEGAALVPGQVIHLSGPGQSGMYNFFYDGAGSLSRIPVSYNGSVLLSPQETAALTSAQGAVVLARQEQTRSVVRTENVAGKVIQGVVVEVGPGRPATVGSGELNKPASCDASEQNLSCAP
ncbi:MAG TPA: filamentous hemagglutinin N-terminal domain-containing protein [Limnobacter sp.]|nr:filamentous hemagglutinin N-terminal domain-containing protein [Limnobacter sp.]